ncbi:hypothetical protein L7F22_061199 [Adiantum nelumboides]|nr:hypothetical protein [Adiantum nelumboides]
MAKSSEKTQDDVSQVVVLLDVNPYFWGRRTIEAAASGSSALTFNQFMQNVVLFLNSILLLNNLNEAVVIAFGARSCGFVFNSNLEKTKNEKQHLSPSLRLLKEVEEFLNKEAVLPTAADSNTVNESSLLSGALSLSLCYIQRTLIGGPSHPQPRILCLQCKSDAPQQYVAVMNAVFSAQRSMIPIDTCIVGNEHSAFLQQAAYITGGVYMKPSLPEGIFQYLTVVFATDLHSRRFLQLPRPAGVDFRASCFCHKKTIDMGFVCSVCLSIFCKKHSSCSTCGANFSQSRLSSIGLKRKSAAIDKT